MMNGLLAIEDVLMEWEAIMQTKEPSEDAKAGASQTLPVDQSGLRLTWKRLYRQMPSAAR